REVLAEPAVKAGRGPERPLGFAAPEPAEEAVEQAARLIAGAEFPIIISSGAGRTKSAFDALAILARDWAIPVVQPDPSDINCATNHECHLGFEVTADLLGRADVVLVIDSAVPWTPNSMGPKKGAKVVSIGPDPLR